jgi:hypothetical protein
MYIYSYILYILYVYIMYILYMDHIYVCMYVTLLIYTIYILVK